MRAQGLRGIPREKTRTTTIADCAQSERPEACSATQHHTRRVNQTFSSPAYVIPMSATGLLGVTWSLWAVVCRFGNGRDDEDYDATRDSMRRGEEPEVSRDQVDGCHCR
ncbi:hypothetical protein ADJ73_04540 [Arsenicicoccus sp. oral taxon 190]|nr:hypothetical protein ADJ73_04540 [Arsenicicoccus sp. oral taxon 190]